MRYYVNANALKGGDGSELRPFRRIQEAADLAAAGDEVFVFPGVYRESVNPVHGGKKDARILYYSVKKQEAVITGAELVRNWEKAEGSVWTARVPNSMFGNENPYTTLVSGDWYIASKTAHIGDVFLNGKSMYEMTELDKVKEPEISKESWDPDFSVYTWYTEQDQEKDETVFYANFHDMDPNIEDVEISVRKTCFYPEKEGIGYITLSGFTVTKAATQWAPPTAYQEGMIGPHWSKGWIIEDCDISESKCSGISLGKYKQKGNDNKWLKEKYKDGTQTERECICQAQKEGWTKEKIGHHIVRRCEIHDCGQTGIVGHLGGAFSLIEDNHIHHINNKQNLAGAEIGGIKMHAAIDVVFRRNHIHNCTRGIWLDWQAQGTRVTQNFLHDNTLPALGDNPEIGRDIFQAMGEDLFIEVSHGPTLVDNNVMLSARAMKIAAQGVAVVHNMIGGSLVAIGIGTDNGAKTLSSARYTPYHFPHETEVAGFMTILHGDVRFYNNIFVQQKVNPILMEMEKIMSSIGNEWDDCCVSVGTMRYDGYQTEEEWKKEFEGYCGQGSEPSDRYYIPLPVWSEGNMYFNGAKPWEKEKNYVEDREHEIKLSVENRDGKWILHTNLYKYISKGTLPVISTKTLGKAFEPEQLFENPDGTEINFDEDYFGQCRAMETIAGPFEITTAQSRGQEIVLAPLCSVSR